ncbi:MAG: ABC transporter permease [Oscillospiraceae bacterium]|jgi:spermidine/putrescine transport system permease protein|nr:ABC transporter permease [Oscillospiraceae bacterium]
MIKKRGRVSRTMFLIYSCIVLGFLYAPIAVMVLFSFNAKENRSTTSFQPASLYWYKEVLVNDTAMQALRNTIFLALLAAGIAVILGTIAAISVDRMRRKWVQTAVLQVTNLPLMNPEIVTGISLMLLFVFAAQLLGLREKLNFTTMLLAHITFCLPYVVLSILPKLRQMDPHLVEAAQDLGCSQFRAFFKVTLPFIRTGIVSAFIMAVTISLDDFVISYFVSGSDFVTLPLYLFSLTRKRVKPDIYALSTLVFAAIFLLMLLSNFVQIRAEKRAKK